MAYGRSQAIKLYQNSLDSSGDTGNGAHNFVNHYTSNMDTLKSFWITPEDQFITDESGESTSIALGTTPVAESGKTPVTTNNKSPPLPSTTGSNWKTSSGPTNHKTKSRTVPTVTSTSNNDSTRGLLNRKNPPSLCYIPTPCKQSNEGGTTAMSNQNHQPPATTTKLRKKQSPVKKKPTAEILSTDARKEQAQHSNTPRDLTEFEIIMLEKAYSNKLTTRDMKLPDEHIFDNVTKLSDAIQDSSLEESETVLEEGNEKKVVDSSVEEAHMGSVAQALEEWNTEKVLQDTDVSEDKDIGIFPLVVSSVTESSKNETTTKGTSIKHIKCVMTREGLLLQPQILSPQIVTLMDMIELRIPLARRMWP
jgi:hypothetical protein